MPIKKTAKKVAKVHEESAFALPVTPVTTAAIPKSHKKMRIGIGITLTAIIVVVTSLNLFWHYQKTQSLQENPVISSELKQEEIVSHVGKLIELPKNEQPTIATVSDITKLRGQPFFQNAKNGDIVLIYPKAGAAILYDPTVNKILKTGPININGQAVAGASTQSKTPSAVPTTTVQVTVALYNGTTIEGLTRKVASQLAQQMPNATVVQNANASKQDYSKTLVVDLSGHQSAAAKQLASLLNGTVGNFPSTETVPTNADIVVILGLR